VRRVYPDGAGGERQPGGVEFPAEQCLSGTTAEELARARDAARARGLGIVADGGVVEEEPLRRWIPQAAALGAPVLRVILSRVLGGNRREMRGGWRAHLERACAALKAVRPVAEAHGVTVAVENHQDVTSEELLWLCETVGGDRIGITLDPGSTLAVAEGPVEFAQRVRSPVRNVHLKDYHIFLSPTGYRLCTCGIGEGVVDFPALFADRPDPPMSIELGARQARHVELLQDDWWTEYPPRPLGRLVEALRVLLPRARPAGYQLQHVRRLAADPMWLKDPKLTVLRDEPKYGVPIGYPDPPNEKVALSWSKYIVLDVFAKAVQSGDAKGAADWGVEQLKRGYGIS